MSNKLGSPYVQLVSKTTAYTVEPDDDVLLVDASAAAVTVTLYDPNGKFSGAADVGRIKIVKTDSSPNPVTITPAAGAVVGQSVLRGPGQSVDLISDGISNWFSFAPIQNSFESQIALTTANILAMNGAPVTLIPAMGAGLVAIVESIILKMVRTSTQFANGGAVEYRYTGAAGAKVSADMSASLITGAAGTAYASVAGVTAELTPVPNSPIVITNASAAFITGTGAGVITIRHRVVNA